MDLEETETRNDYAGEGQQQFIRPNDWATGGFSRRAQFHGVSPFVFNAYTWLLAYNLKTGKERFLSPVFTACN
jgi:hypothetical protein